MAIFANISNDAALIDGPVQASDVNLNGLFVTPNGFTRASSTGGPPVTFSQGAPIDANGCVCVQPNGSVATWSNGLPLDNHGRICISDDPVAFVSNGLPFALNSLLRASSMAFSPLSLFAAGEPGAWYDPADFSTLFQDAAGTTPVTGVEQPVGRILDKSGNGNHATQPTATSRPILRQEAGGQHYLAFDGTDDWLQTGPIDFTSTDKMTVFAGVRKLSDAQGIVAELSQNMNSNNGSFFLLVGTDTWGTGYGSIARGTAQPNVEQVARFPIGGADTSVLSITHDIAGDLSTLRRNGVSGTSGTGDKGAGNFGNYPLYIGRRGGTTLPLNGRLYALIIRGAASSATQINVVERYVANKTGVTL